MTTSVNGKLGYQMRFNTTTGAAVNVVDGVLIEVYMTKIPKDGIYPCTWLGSANKTWTGIIQIINGKPHLLSNKSDTWWNDGTVYIVG